MLITLQLSAYPTREPAGEQRTAYIEPGSPWENPFVESFNGKLRDEFFAREIFDTVMEARILHRDYTHTYNHHRPHSALGYMTPAAFAAAWTSGKSITPNPSPWNGLQRPGRGRHPRPGRHQQRPATISRRGHPHGWSDHPPAKERHVYNMKKSSTQKVESPSQLIDARIKELGDWRGKTLSRLRALIKQADPEVVEEWKWRKPSHPGVPVWSHQGPICTGETYKSVVKLTFFRGASLKDPSGLFNSSLEGNTRRAIDFHEDDEIDEKAFATLIRAAVSLNESSSR